MIGCECEPKDALDVITDADFSAGQIVRLYFQRTKTGTVENVLTIASQDPTILTTWTDLTALTTSEKVIQSPIFHEFTSAGGGVIEQTGNMANGIPLTIGEEPHTWNFELLDKDQATTIKLMKDLMCEIGTAEGLSMYAVNECGNIIGQTTDDFVTFKGIPIAAMSVLGLDKFGHTTKGSNMVKITLKADWADYLHAVRPVFNAQTVIF